MTAIEEAVRANRETTTFDYKERLNWDSGRQAQVELLRDLVGFANRDGGMIVVGIKDLGGGNFAPLGLQPDDPIPDPTAIGQLMREYFDPTVEVSSGSATVDGVLYGYIVVSAFSVSPLIATKDMHDAVKKKAMLTDGDLLIRSDALATEKVKARDLRAMLDRAVTARGRAFAGQLPPRLPPPSDDPSWGPAVPGTRLFDLRPVPPPSPKRLREVEDLVQEARVISRFGMVFMPSEIDLQSGRVIRETGRVIAQARDRASDGDNVTTAEVTDQLVVRIREAPWEHRDSESGPTADATSLVLFVLAATMFAVRLYERNGVEACHYRIGLASPAGLRLTLNRAAFLPFSSAYVASSRTDIWVDRTPNIRDLATADQRSEFTFDVLEEFFDYFGWRVKRETLEVQIKHIGSQGGLYDV